MDPKALILLVLSAFAAIILAIGAGMGQDYRSRESTNSTSIAATNSSLISEDVNPKAECIRFFTEYDRRNCSYNYNDADCYSIILPEDNKLTDHDRGEFNGIGRAYPDVSRLFNYFRLRKEDAQFINRLLRETGWRIFSWYHSKPLEHALNILNYLNGGFSRTDCWYRRRYKPNFPVPELKAFIQNRRYFAQILSMLMQAVVWDDIDITNKDRLINLIIHIGDSLDISIRDCWIEYRAKNPNIVNSPYHELCSPGKRLGIDLKETFLNNTSTQSHVRPKRDLPGKKPRNNANISEFGDAQVLKKKQDDLGKSKEAPKRPMHAGKSYEKMRGNGNLLRLRRGLAIKNTNKIPL